MFIKYSTNSILKVWKSYVSIMMIRKIKPVQVDAGITNKLKASNFITNLNDIDDINISNQQNNIDKLQITNPQKSLKKQQKLQINKQRTDKKKIKTQNLEQSYKSKKGQLKSQNKTPQSITMYKNNKKQIIQKQQINLQNAIKNLGKALDSIDPHQLRKYDKDIAAIQQNKQIQLAIQQMKQLQLQDFSVLAHRLLVNSTSHNNTVQKYIWKQIQQNFLTRFEVTTNPHKIRSYSKIIYCLAKSKVHRDNSSTLVSTSMSTNLQSLQTKFAILLPSASHQSFTMIVTSLSRMGPLSQQFSYIIQRLYYSRYKQFNPRQRIQINYALTRNSRKVDKKLHTFISSMNLKEILVMLRCYLNSNQLNKEILQLAQRNIILRKKEMNVIDIGDICNIYFQAMGKEGDPYKISQQLQKILTEMYSILKKNINQVTFQKIWKNLPVVVNRGFLQVDFVQQIMKTLKILRKKQVFPQRIWNPLRESFKQFENLQLRTRLEEIK